MKITIGLCLCLVVGLSAVQDAVAWPSWDVKACILAVCSKKRSDDVDIDSMFGEADTNADQFIDLQEYESAEPEDFNDALAEVEFANVLLRCDEYPRDEKLSKAEFGCLFGK